MQTILEKFEKHLKPIDQVKDKLYPPASAKEIESVENELAIIFPEDLRTLYKWHNGQVGTYFFLMNLECIH